MLLMGIVLSYLHISSHWDIGPPSPTGQTLLRALAYIDRNHWLPAEWRD